MINFTTAVMQTDDMLDFLKVLIKYYIMSSNYGEFFSGNSFLNKFETGFFLHIRRFFQVSVGSSIF